MNVVKVLFDSWFLFIKKLLIKMFFEIVLIGFIIIIKYKILFNCLLL